MRTAVLPFNAAAETSPALARQLAAFAAETLRSIGGQINSVNYLAQIDQGGQQRAAFVNVSDTLNEYSFMDPLFRPGEGADPQASAERVMDGLLKKVDNGFEATYRFFSADSPEPLFTDTVLVNESTIFEVLNKIILKLAEVSETELPEPMRGGLDFGTDSGKAFLKFLEGYDALSYIQQANGMVAQEFSPDGAFELFKESLEEDKDFVAPYESLCALARTCGHYRIGTFESAEKYLLTAIDMVPEDFKASYSLGELYGVVNLHAKSAEAYEKALRIHDGLKPEEAAALEEWKLEQASLYSRIGLAQLNNNMPVNAELNLRKAIELEGPDKPSIGLLQAVLERTNRQHEVPALWKAQMEANPQSAEYRTNYAIALHRADRQKEAVEVFEKGLEELEDNVFLKRFYAPLLVNNGDLDRAMDFYEDALDVAPTDVPLMIEYAQTLAKAEREFEIPAVLDNILKANPDPNTRAEVLAWKTEITEPKRAEAVKTAEEKMVAGDFEGAAKDLRPLRNWLADYWKLWAVLAAANNRAGNHEEAKESAQRLLALYPGCEPGYAELMSALSALGEHQEAFQLMQFAASQLPQSLGIQINLALAAKRAGEVEFARNLSRQLREAIGPNEELKPIFDDLES
jgi:tetratricopeptide (TPR) repeat protein